MRYRQRVLKTAQRLAAAGFPCTCRHTPDLDLEDSVIDIAGTDFHVQVCLHGDYAVGVPHDEGTYLQLIDCPTFMDVINRLIQLKEKAA